MDPMPILVVVNMANKVNLLPTFVRIPEGGQLLQPLKGTVGRQSSFSVRVPTVLDGVLEYSNSAVIKDKLGREGRPLLHSDNYINEVLQADEFAYHENTHR